MFLIWALGHPGIIWGHLGVIQESSGGHPVVIQRSSREHPGVIGGSSREHPESPGVTWGLTGIAFSAAYIVAYSI
eukprot:12210395-Karenia_brevis.AAC.1